MTRSVVPSRAGGAALAEEGEVVGEADGADGVDMAVSRSGRPRARGFPGRGELRTKHCDIKRGLSPFSAR